MKLCTVSPRGRHGKDKIYKASLYSGSCSPSTGELLTANVQLYGPNDALVLTIDRDDFNMLKAWFERAPVKGR